MSQTTKFVQISDLEIKYGMWKYTGGTVRFSAGKIFVPQTSQKKVDKGSRQ